MLNSIFSAKYLIWTGSHFCQIPPAPPTCWKSPLEVRTFRFPFSFHLIGGGDVLSDYNRTGLGIEIANTSCSNVGYMLWFIHGILLWMKKDGSLEMFVFFNFFPKFFFAYCRYMIYLCIYIYVYIIYTRHRWTFEYTVYIRDQFFFASGRRARRFDIRQVDVVLNWWFFQSLLDVDGGGSQNSMDIKPSGHGNQLPASQNFCQKRCQVCHFWFNAELLLPVEKSDMRPMS